MKIQRITSNQSLFSEDLHKLYLEAFPENERKPIDALYAHQEAGFSDVFVILEEDNSFVGMITTLKRPQLMFVEYFAIAPEYRGLGYGSKVLSLLHNKYKDVNICLEIEVVNTDAGIQDERVRRLQFYENNGFQQLNIVVNLFGVEFELLGTSPDIRFEDYALLYQQIHGEAIKEVLYLIK